MYPLFGAGSVVEGSPEAKSLTRGLRKERNTANQAVLQITNLDRIWTLPKKICSIRRGRWQHGEVEVVLVCSSSCSSWMWWCTGLVVVPVERRQPKQLCDGKKRRSPLVSPGCRRNQCSDRNRKKIMEEDTKKKGETERRSVELEPALERRTHKQR